MVLRGDGIVCIWERATARNVVRKGNRRVRSRKEGTAVDAEQQRRGLRPSVRQCPCHVTAPGRPHQKKVALVTNSTWLTYLLLVRLLLTLGAEGVPPWLSKNSTIRQLRPCHYCHVSTLIVAAHPNRRCALRETQEAALLTIFPTCSVSLTPTSSSSLPYTCSFEIEIKIEIHDQGPTNQASRTTDRQEGRKEEKKGPRKFDTKKTK